MSAPIVPTLGDGVEFHLGDTIRTESGRIIETSPDLHEIWLMPYANDFGEHEGECWVISRLVAQRTVATDISLFFSVAAGIA